MPFDHLMRTALPRHQRCLQTRKCGERVMAEHGPVGFESLGEAYGRSTRWVNLLDGVSGGAREWPGSVWGLQQGMRLDPSCGVIVGEAAE